MLRNRPFVQSFNHLFSFYKSFDLHLPLESTLFYSTIGDIICKLWSIDDVFSANYINGLIDVHMWTMASTSDSPILVNSHPICQSFHQIFKVYIFLICLLHLCHTYNGKTYSYLWISFMCLICINCPIIYIFKAFILNESTISF